MFSLMTGGGVVQHIITRVVYVYIWVLRVIYTCIRVLRVVPSSYIDTPWVII